MKQPIITHKDKDPDPNYLRKIIQDLIKKYSKLTNIPHQAIYQYYNLRKYDEP